MSILVNNVYKLNWRSSLETTFNGIYKVLAILTYTEAIELKVDLKKDVYDRCNISEQFDLDLDQIRVSKILKLKNSTTGAVVHLPDFHLVEIPNADVEQYPDMALAVHLGVFTTSEELDTIRRDIEDLINARLGVTEKVLMYSVNNKWLTTAEYETIEADRASGGLDLSNNYTKRIGLEKEVLDLKTKIAQYEQLIISLDGSLATT